MKKYALAIAGLLLLAAPAEAAHWTVDHAKSRIGFSVIWDREPFAGTFRKWNADIDFDPNDLAHSHVAVTIDIASEQSDEADFDQGLKGALGFQVTKFPQGRFETTRITRKDKTHYLAEGTLTLRGISKPVALPFALTIDGGHAHMTGTAGVIRTEFGVGRGLWSAPDPVAHEVTVSVDLTAEKSP